LLIIAFDDSEVPARTIIILLPSYHHHATRAATDHNIETRHFITPDATLSSFNKHDALRAPSSNNITSTRERRARAIKHHATWRKHHHYSAAPRHHV